MSTFFCSAVARAENEQLFGTAKQIGVYVALEYWPAWKRKAIESELVPHEVRQFVARIRERIPEIRFLLVRQKESRHRKPSCFVALPRESCAAVYQWELEDYRDIGSLDVAALLSGAPGLPRREDPLFLVCTHAQHDKCCAKHGNSAVEAARPESGGHIWESSHLGGCRFAANLICLPQGLLYGFLSPEDAIRVIRDYHQGRIHLPKLRGRVCYEKPVQAAEYFVRREAGSYGMDELRLVSSVQRAPESWTTTFAAAGAGTGFSVVHTVSRSDEPRLLACNDVEPEYVWTNHLSSIRRVPCGAGNPARSRPFRPAGPAESGSAG
jgi:hypothetical protein